MGAAYRKAFCLIIKINRQICAGMHSNGFCGAYCPPQANPTRRRSEESMRENAVSAQKVLSYR